LNCFPSKTTTPPSRAHSSFNTSAPQQKIMVFIISSLLRNLILHYYVVNRYIRVHRLVILTTPAALFFCLDYPSSSRDRLIGHSDRPLKHMRAPASSPARIGTRHRHMSRQQGAIGGGDAFAAFGGQRTLSPRLFRLQLDAPDGNHA
jgi:hypothetical protein